MVQRAEVLATKSNNLDLVPRINVVEGENQLLQGIFWPRHIKHTNI